jgi:hypothetical protein
MLELLKADRAPRQVVNDRQSEEDEAAGEIRCPHCGWQPSSSDRWCCESVDGPEPPFPSCGTVWNTFATRGRCPGCDHQWHWTSCLRCHEWSLHEDWYAANR